MGKAHLNKGGPLASETSVASATRVPPIGGLVFCFRQRREVPVFEKAKKHKEIMVAVPILILVVLLFWPKDHKSGNLLIEQAQAPQVSIGSAPQQNAQAKAEEALSGKPATGILSGQKPNADTQPQKDSTSKICGIPDAAGLYQSAMETKTVAPPANLPKGVRDMQAVWVGSATTVIVRIIDLQVTDHSIAARVYVDIMKEGHASQVDTNISSDVILKDEPNGKLWEIYPDYPWSNGYNRMVMSSDGKHLTSPVEAEPELLTRCAF